MKTPNTTALSWVSRDGKLIILGSGVRAFTQGFVAVILVVYLAGVGLELVEIGAFLSAGFAGNAVMTFFVGIVAERSGRRRLMVAFPLLAAASGAALVLTDDVRLLLIFAFLGTLGGEAGLAGPTLPLEQASLADAAAPQRRTDLFALYRIVSMSASATGALAAGLPVVFSNVFGVGELDGLKAMFVGFGLCLALTATLYRQLSPAIEVQTTSRRWINPLRLPSRRIVFTLTGLFSIDHFAGALLSQSLVAYWFIARFGLDLASLAMVFFVARALTAVSMWVAARMANRIGVLNTMVFTHTPSSILLIAVMLAPTAAMAVLLWQARALLGSMDVPTRDSYIMAIVAPEERVAMGSAHMVGRSVLGTAGPSLGTALWQTLSASAPFIACATLKIAYDWTLYFMFRHVKPYHERQVGSQAQRQEA